jgi:hypothetical protein
MSDEQVQKIAKLQCVDGDYTLVSAHWLSWETRRFFWNFEETKELVDAVEHSKPYHIPFPKPGEEEGLKLKFHVTRGGRFVLDQPDYCVKVNQYKHRFPREGVPDRYLDDAYEHLLEIEPAEIHGAPFQEMLYEVD